MPAKPLPFRIKWQTEQEAAAEAQKWWVVRKPLRRETEGAHGTLCVCGVAHSHLPAHSDRVLRALIRERQKRHQERMDTLAQA